MPRPKMTKESQTESGAQLVKTVPQRTRKHYSAEDKIRVVLEGLRGDQAMAAICRQETVTPRVLHVAEGVHGSGQCPAQKRIDATHEP